MPMARALRFLAGLLLLPLCWAVARATLDLSAAVLASRPPWTSPDLPALLAGYFGWVLLFALLSPPARAYVWGHELTHAFWGLMTGSRVGGLRVDADGGSVRVSRPGLFTTLAPYLVPFYTLLVLLARLLLGLFLDMRGWAPFWLFLTGLTWGFHLTFTLRALAQRQPDILAYGRLFSCVLIFLGNIAGIGCGLAAATRTPLPRYRERLAARACASYGGAARGLAASARAGRELAGRLARGAHRGKMAAQAQ